MKIQGSKRVTESDPMNTKDTVEESFRNYRIAKAFKDLADLTSGPCGTIAELIADVCLDLVGVPKDNTLIMHKDGIAIGSTVLISSDTFCRDGLYEYFDKYATGNISFGALAEYVISYLD